MNKDVRVLIVEDSPTQAAHLKQLLEKQGYSVHHAANGTDALEIVLDYDPRLIISDVMMDDMNGIDAAINIRKFLPSCKILLFSGQAATAALLENARARGHQFEILKKPVHPQDLLAKLRD